MPIDTTGWEPNFKPDCSDGSVDGTKSTRFDYILKSVTPDYPEDYEACKPYLHGSAQIDDIQVNSSMTGAGEIDVSGNITSGGTVTGTEVSAGGITLTSRKAFDIPHPNKMGWRLRHICLEGPESAVYFRGRLTDSNEIKLPDYWKGLVDPESITVTLTQINSSQDLIVEGVVEWGTKVKVRSGNASKIDCYFLIHGERIDGEKLTVEYEGEQYPGDESQYSVNGGG